MKYKSLGRSGKEGRKWIDAECKCCGGVFSVRPGSKAKYCSKYCRYGSRLRKCEWCGQEFIPRGIYQARCSQACLDGAILAERGIRLHVDIPPSSQGGDVFTTDIASTIGRYVYGWFSGNSCFYVGKGVGSRAWQRHMESGSLSTSALCEKVRCMATDFHVVIFRDNLTEEGAMLVESVLIDLLKPMANRVSGMSRQERPPLELPSNLTQSHKKRKAR